MKATSATPRLPRDARARGAEPAADVHTGDLPAQPGPIRTPVIISGLFALLICTLGTWRLDTHSMEGIIALGGEHMVRSGDWFVPRLYGTVYAYKPALAYWLTGLAQHWLGRSEFAMRLPTALCAAVLCAFTAWVTGRLSSPRVGLYAGLAMTFSALFIEHGRIADFDIPVALGTGIAMLAATHNLVMGRSALNWWILAYLGLAIGFLAKGTPALGMYAPGLLVAALLLRQLRQLFTWQHLVGAAAGAIVLGAYLYLAWREAGPAAFADQRREVGLRSLLWNWRMVGQSLAKPLMIWAVFLPGAVLVPALPWIWRKCATNAPPSLRRLAMALASFFLTGIIVWMAIPTDQNRYYLPLIAAVAGLAGIAAELLSFASASPVGAKEGTEDPRTADRRSGRLKATWRTYQPGFIVAGIGLVYWFVYAGFAQPGKVASRSERHIAAAFAPHLAPQEKVYFDGFDAGSSLFYYLQHPVGRWKLEAAPLADVFMLVINSDNRHQRPALMNRPDIHVEILATERTGEPRTWELARVTRRLPNGN